MTQFCIEEALWERMRVLTEQTTTELENEDLTISPGERQQMAHARRMLELTGSGG